MKRYYLLFAFIVFGCVAAAEAQSTRLAKPQAAVANDTCTTAGCHANVKQYKAVHGPVNVNACDACHKLVDPAQHKYELARNKTETCTFCHKIEHAPSAIVHKPVTDGQCLSCHNPHGGQTAKFLRGKNQAEMCATCHKDTIGDKKHMHGPVAAGACSSCHQSHASQFPKLLNVAQKDLCFNCHTEMKQQMASVKFKHKAVEQDCMSCHDPHASNFVMQIKQPPLQLCVSCHEPVKQAAMNAKVKHSVATKDDSCLNCHTAHGGDLSKLMKAQQVKVCMKCHDKQIDRPNGAPKVVAVAEVLDPKMVKHGPAADGSCGGCHDVHGGQVTRLLKKEYPEVFYQSFDLKKYELCFSCHDKQLVLSEKTTGLTNFRNGEANLHFMHVNKTEKGRSCRACHNVHASPNDLHIRDSVPYGSWNMPINYKKSPDGGNCSPGCHKPYTYDRKNAVPYDTPDGSPTPAPPPAPAPASQPAVASDGKVGTS